MTGHLAWQKSRRQEQAIDPEKVNEITDPGQELRECENEFQHDSKISKAARKALDTLSDLERDIIKAYGLAGDTEIDSSKLGIELGLKHGDGAAIPGGTIRVTKHRAKAKIATEMRKLGFELTQTGAKK